VAHDVRAADVIVPRLTTFVPPLREIPEDGNAAHVGHQVSNKTTSNARAVSVARNDPDTDNPRSNRSAQSIASRVITDEEDAFGESVRDPRAHRGT
jgi:hypothetical protein